MTAHYELHALLTAHDVTLATLSGLPDTSGAEACSNCDAPLLGETFIPRAIILSEDNESVSCLDCVRAVMYPRRGLQYR